MKKFFLGLWWLIKLPFICIGWIFKQVFKGIKWLFGFVKECIFSSVKCLVIWLFGLLLFIGIVVAILFAVF